MPVIACSGDKAMPPQPDAQRSHVQKEDKQWPSTVTGIAQPHIGAPTTSTHRAGVQLHVLGDGAAGQSPPFLDTHPHAPEAPICMSPCTGFRV
jgi:hypothetical protein